MSTALLQTITQTESPTLLLFHPYSYTLYAIFVIFLLKWWFSQQYLKKNLPPSPSKRPLIGNLHQLGLNPHMGLRDLARRYGPVMLLHFGSKPVLVVSSPDAAGEIMKTHDIIFANRPKMSLLDKLHYNCKDMATAPYGEYWRQMKSICVLHLLSNRRVQSFQAIREEEVSLMVGKIKQLRSSSPNSSVNLSEIIMRLTNDVICRAALGMKYGVGDDGDKFKKLLADLFELMGVFSFGDYMPWLVWVDKINGSAAKAEKVAKDFDDFFNRVIQEHIQNDNTENSADVIDLDHEDFVHVLLRIQRENLTTIPLDMLSIKGLILDIFAGGTGTTFKLLVWAMSELIKNPMVMKKLQNEVRGIVGRGKTHITENNLESMHYMKAVIKESLRLHPPIPLLLPRESTQEIKIKGYHIPAKTQVLINAWAIGRDPEFWEEPDEFKPERFLNSEIDYKGHDFQYIPFGAGRRGCPGVQFAAAVMELALAKLVHDFDWELPDGVKGEYLDMSVAPGINLHRMFPLLAVPTPYSC